MGQYIKIINVFLLLIMIIYIIKIVRDNKNLEIQLKNEVIKKDSLFNENYPCQIELNRYQIAFELFAKRNPKGADEYATIISLETE